MFVWPSAVLMGCLLTHLRDELRGSTVLEIGAGVGLPAVLASKYGAAKVVACERPDVPAAVENLVGNLVENCPAQFQSGSCLAVRASCAVALQMRHRCFVTYTCIACVSL